MAIPSGSRLDFDRIGVVVGLTAEARIARRRFSRVAVGGGTAAGAERAARRLVEEGASGLLSFGLAGGLDPLLRPGTVIVADAVQTGGRCLLADPTIGSWLGGATPHSVLGADKVVGSAADKQHLFVATGCAAVDLESGAVASVADMRGLAFGVLRAICDPAERDLPPAALAALTDAGAIGLLRVMASVVGRPRQLPMLLALAGDAAVARRALIRRVGVLAQNTIVSVKKRPF